MACGQLPACAQLFLVASPSATNGSASGFVALGWNPSPDTNVTGYFLGWGLSSDACTNLLDAGSATSVTVAGLAANVTYYFTVVAYDNAGDQSPPSNVVTYAPGSVVSYASGSTLSIQPTSGGNAPGLSLSFQGQAGVMYSLQATMDFTNWATIFTTNCPAAGVVAFVVTDMASYPRRFYRLGQQSAPYAPGSTLSIQPTSGSEAPGLSLSFQGQAGVMYSLQATMDFTNWATIFTTNCPAAGPVAFQVTDMASYPRRFYRVQQQ